MKNLLLFLVLLTCSFAQAQMIHVRVVGVKDSTVNIGYPINEVNFAWWRNGPSKAIDAAGRVSFPNTLTKPANIYLTSDKRYENVFVEPGEDVSVTIDYSGKQKVLHFEGKNAEGNMLLGALNHPFYQEKGRAYVKRDSTANGIKLAVLEDMQKELSGFDSLLKAKKVTPTFYSYAANEVKYYYAAAYGAAMYNGFLRTKYPKTHREYKATMDPELTKAWPEVFKLFSLKDASAIKASEFYYYAYDYISFYKLGYVAEQSGNVKNKITAENRHQLRSAAFSANFSGATLEYLLARYMFDEAMQKEFDANLLKVYTDFRESFPKSKYTRLLTPLMTEIIAFHQKAAKPPTGQELLDRNYFSSFEDLAMSFKGRTVYVDLWATWCVPCKEEFAFNPGLKSYLKSKDINILYISMDTDNADKQWKEMMKYYDLTGYHLRVNDALKNDIIYRFYNGKGYSIPRYMIIKDGKIVNDDAMRPSDKEKLYKQIDQESY